MSVEVTKFPCAFGSGDSVDVYTPSDHVRLYIHDTKGEASTIVLSVDDALKLANQITNKHGRYVCQYQPF